MLVSVLLMARSMYGCSVPKLWLGLIEELWSLRDHGFYRSLSGSAR